MKKEKKPPKPFMSGYKTYEGPRGNQSQWANAWKQMNHADAVSAIENDDPLTVMGFTQTPTKAELDKRYYELVKIHHPDRGGDPKQFIKIHAAWSILCQTH
jgi:hypothetical protein